MRLLGIDFGLRRIGIAISDEEGRIAFPRSVIANTTNAGQQIADVVREEGVGKVVCGLSTDSSGEDNPVMEKARIFTEELARMISVPIVFQGESFSTSHAAQEKMSALSEDGRVLSPEKKALAEEDIDASAAALILQRYIEQNSHGNN